MTPQPQHALATPSAQGHPASPSPKHRLWGATLWCNHHPIIPYPLLFSPILSSPTGSPVQEVCHLDKVSLLEAARGERGRADAHTARVHGALVARHAVLVERDGHQVEHILGAAAAGEGSTRGRVSITQACKRPGCTWGLGVGRVAEGVTRAEAHPAPIWPAKCIVLPVQHQCMPPKVGKTVSACSTPAHWGVPGCVRNECSSPHLHARAIDARRLQVHQNEMVVGAVCGVARRSVAGQVGKQCGWQWSARQACARMYACACVHACVCACANLHPQPLSIATFPSPSRPLTRHHLVAQLLHALAQRLAVGNHLVVRAHGGGRG